MAADPTFSATPNIGAGLLTAGAETDLQVPTKTATIFTAGASGSIVNEIVVHMTATGAGGLVATSVAGLVYVFLHDGSTYNLWDTIQIQAVTASTTAAPWRSSKTYQNLILKTGWTVRCSQSIAGNQSATLALKVVATGGDF